MSEPYKNLELTREEVDAMPGPLVLDFGTNWCGYCQAAQPAIDEAFESHADIRHIKVEDGKGRLLGRSFKVKLWPTLIFMAGGQEIDRVVRPIDARQVAEALVKITPSDEGRTLRVE